MSMMNRTSATVAGLLLMAAAMSGCQSLAPDSRSSPRNDTSAHQLHVINRVTWGANTSSAREIAAVGTERWLEAQLKPSARAVLPEAVQAQIDALTISQKPFAELAMDLEQRRRAFVAMRDPAEQKVARQAYQQELGRLGRENATRAILRAVYSPQQLQEQMTWFWMNHFS